MITELIEFEVCEGISNEQLITKAEKVVTDFHKKQDGYIDMELVKDNLKGIGKMIVHYETMEDIEKVKNNIPHSKAVKEFTGLLKPESLNVSFYEKQKKWTA